MIFIGRNVYSKVPKRITKEFQDVPELLRIVDDLASASGQFYFADWSMAVANAFHRALKYTPDILTFCSPEAITKPDAPLKFLHAIESKLYWSSRIITFGEEVISHRHVIPKFINKKIKGAERGFLQHYSFFNPIKNEYISPFVALLLNAKTSHSLRNYRALKNIDHTMNCEEFVAYTLLNFGLVSFYALSDVFKQCKAERSYNALHLFLGLDSADDILDLDGLDALKEVSVLFEINNKGKVSHMLIYEPTERNIYELAFGKESSDFRVLKTSSWAYIESPAKRGKALKACPIPRLTQALDEKRPDI